MPDTVHMAVGPPAATPDAALAVHLVKHGLDADESAAACAFTDTRHVTDLALLDDGDVSAASSYRGGACDTAAGGLDAEWCV